MTGSGEQAWADNSIQYLTEAGKLHIALLINTLMRSDTRGGQLSVILGEEEFESCRDDQEKDSRKNNGPEQGSRGGYRKPGSKKHCSRAVWREQDTAEWGIEDSGHCTIAPSLPEALLCADSCLPRSLVLLRSV